METKKKLDLVRIEMRLPGVIAFLRGAWRNDGAEGESVHAVCEDAEQLLTEVRRYRALPAIDALLAEVDRVSDAPVDTEAAIWRAEDAALAARNALRADDLAMTRIRLVRAAAWALLAVRRIDAEAAEKDGAG